MRVLYVAIDDNSSLEPPDPIPNSEVKRSHANDSLAMPR